MAGGVAAMVIGTVILSTPMWAGVSHAYMGRNWVDVLAWPIYISGTILVLIGLTLLGRAAWIPQDKEVAALEFRTP